MSKDSAQEKWIYWKHTQVKHAILENYLWRWIPSLGKYQRLSVGSPGRVCYFDGFAGRGEYKSDDGATYPGSPLIAMEVAEKLVELGRVKEFVPVFVERDFHNFQNLEKIIQQNLHRFPHVREPIRKYGEFSKEISNIIKEVGARLAPSFFFIDPFGFSGGDSGVPFAVVKDILSIPRTEIFFTFMVRDINRFLERDDLKQTFNGLFGTEEWLDCMQTVNREHCLRELYVKQLRQEAKASYTWDFRICADEKIQTTYYLVHATNKFEGLKYMKEVMHKQSGGLFAYLGPDEIIRKYQMKLFDDDMPSLKNFYLERFAGHTLTHRQLLEYTYIDTPFIESDQKKAIKELNNEGKVVLEEAGPRGGINENTKITFI